MRWRLLFSLIMLTLALVPAVALAADSTNEDDVLVRVNGPVNLGPNEHVGTLVVVGDNASIAGSVTNVFVLVDGDATISGTVDGDVVVVRGTLTLQPTAHVTGDVNEARGEVITEPGAVVGGSIVHRSYDWSGWDFFLFSIYLWISLTIVILIAGLVFAAVGGRQLIGSANLISDQTGGTILAAIIVGIGIPILAVAAMITILGIPLGLGLLIFLIPALWFFGYLVAGTKFGAVILRQQNNPHPYLAALLGLILLQLIGLIPFIGGFVSFVAGILGTGALVLYAWKAWRGPGTAAPARVEYASPAPGD
ncbi:MAG TPA: polymer-forming cytoskeletal protein [Nitrolancea sp.]